MEYSQADPPSFDMTVLRRISTRIARAPTFADDEHTQRSLTFHRTVWTIIPAHSSMLLLILFFQPDIVGRTTTAILTNLALGLITIEINRRGRTTLASIVLISGMVAKSTFLALGAGGIRSPGVSMYFIFVMMAGMLLGQRAAIIAAASCLALALILVLLEQNGMLPAGQVRYSPPTLWLLNAYYVGVILALLRIATGALTKALSRARTELKERRAAEQERERALLDLSERVKELRLLHDAAKLLRDRYFDRNVLQELADVMPRAWKHPEVCEARITFLDMEVTTPGWRESPWALGVEFMTSGGGGTITVEYTEERPAEVEGPFLAEEKILLQSLAEMLVPYLEWDQVERRRKVTENQLRQSQKMEALGTLAGGIAHDFNNILGAIVGNAELGLMGIDQTHPAKESLDEIRKASARASDIVKRILLFSRRQEPEKKVIPLQPVVEEAVRLVKVSLPKNVVVQSSFAKTLPDISGDASQLYQVVMNLATNAAHAMSVKGGTLSVTMDHVLVDDAEAALSADLHPGQYVRVIVSDNGTGMSRETLDRVFEPFFTTKGHAGTGLGLSVVHGIVQDHGGAILMESELGKGTTSRVYFPALGAAGATATEGAPDEWRGGGETIMYVDDEEALISVMERTLRLLNYTCVSFGDPVAALEEFRANPDRYVAVLTDLAMPQMSGLDLAQQLKEIRPDLRIALVSGHHEVGPRATQLGVAVRVQKPFTVDVLGFSLHQLLRQKR